MIMLVFLVMKPPALGLFVLIEVEVAFFQDFLGSRLSYTQSPYLLVIIS